MINEDYMTLARSPEHDLFLDHGNDDSLVDHELKHLARDALRSHQIMQRRIFVLVSPLDGFWES